MTLRPNPAKILQKKRENECWLLIGRRVITWLQSTNQKRRERRFRGFIRGFIMAATGSREYLFLNLSIMYEY